MLTSNLLSSSSSQALPEIPSVTLVFPANNSFAVYNPIFPINGVEVRNYLFDGSVLWLLNTRLEPKEHEFIAFAETNWLTAIICSKICKYIIM